MTSSRATSSRARATCAAAVLLAVLTGCSGSSDDGSPSGLSADEQTAADNLAAQVLRSESVSGRSGEGAITEEQAACIAEGAVSDVGLADLQDYGIVTDDLLVNKEITGVEMEADDADALAAVFVACLDAEGLFEQQLLAGATKKPTDDERRCVEELVDSGSVRAILSTSFQGRTSGVYDRLQDKVLQCADQDRPAR